MARVIETKGQLMLDLGIAPTPSELRKAASQIQPNGEPIPRHYGYPMSKMSWLQRCKVSVKRHRIKETRERYKNLYPQLAEILRKLSVGYSKMDSYALENTLLLMDWHIDTWMRSKGIEDGN